LFDGVPGTPGRSGTAADIAARLRLPVLLVLDVAGQSQSAAASVRGFATHDPQVHIAGVVLNRVGSARHRRLAGEAIEALGVKVVGSIPRLDALALPERHLGLVQAGEFEALDQRLDEIADAVAAHVDLSAIEALARQLKLMPSAIPPAALAPPGQCIALARDAAFSFLYPHLLSGWRAAGAELRFFSPLADEPPPEDCDACWLPGGYPELHAGQLAGAARFRQGLRRFARARPVHGECGGYMALGAALTDASGARHEMAGLLGVETSFAKRRMTLGYREATLDADSALGPAGARFRGHEFHYATIVSLGDDPPLAFVRDPYGSAPERSGSRRGGVTGSFFHAIARA
jgi:cobyrinic acid a,c-diamide synthase